MERRIIEVWCPHRLEASTLASSAGWIERWRARADKEMDTLLIVAIVALPLLAVLILFGPELSLITPNAPAPLQSARTPGHA